MLELESSQETVRQPLIARDEFVMKDESEILQDFLEAMDLLDQQEGQRFSEESRANMRRYVQRQQRLNNTRVSRKYVETAIEVTERSVRHEYTESRAGLAFKLLPAGQGVYIPMAPRYSELRGTQRMSWSDATFEHKPEFDQHPTAKMVYPVSSWYWRVLCFQWLFDAGLDVADVLSDINMCVSLLLSEESVGLSSWVKYSYISLTLLSFVSELVSALYIVCSSDRHVLDEVHNRYPILGRNKWCPNFLIVKTWAQFVFLRYLAVPERFISPHDTFLTHDHGGSNHFLPLDHRDLECDRSELAVYVTDRVRYEYRVVEGYLAKVPKFIMEDICVWGLAVYMAFLLKSSASITASIIGFFNCVRGVQKLITYSRAARNKRRSLVAYVDGTGDETEFKKFNGNPLRRLITLGTGQPRRR